MGLSISTVGTESLQNSAAPYGLKAEYMRLWANALERHPHVKDGTVKLTILTADMMLRFSKANSRQWLLKVTMRYFAPIDINAGVAMWLLQLKPEFRLSVPTLVNSELLTLYGPHDVKEVKCKQRQSVRL